MKSATAFPQSKIKEIALTDPDVKDISKPAIEVLKNAAEIFAAQFFQKCFEQAHKGKRITSKISDFIAVVNRDEALNQMLNQFIVDKKDLIAEENEEDKDIENAADEIAASNHDSENNSDNEFEKNEVDENDNEIEIDEIVKMNKDSSDSEYNDDEANFKDDENSESDQDQDDNKEEEDIDQEKSKEDESSFLGHKSISSSSTDSDLEGESEDIQDLDVDDD